MRTASSARCPRPSSAWPTRAACARWWSARCATARWRSEEHTSELQSRLHLVCRLLLEKKKTAATTRLIHGAPTAFMRYKIYFVPSMDYPIGYGHIVIYYAADPAAPDLPVHEEFHSCIS